MRIVYCYPEPLPSPHARSIQVVRTCCALAQIFDRVSLITAWSPADPNDIFAHYGLERPANLDLIPIKREIGSIVSNAWFNWKLKRTLRSTPGDIILTRHLKTARALLHSGVPLIYEAHEVFSAKTSKARRNLRMERRIFRYADGLIYISHGLKSDLEQKFHPSAPSRVIPNSTLVPATFPLKPRLETDIEWITYTGSTRYKWKGIDVLLEALTMLPDSVALEIVGEFDPEDETRKALLEHIGSARIKVSGRVAPGEVPAILERSRIAVIPNSADDRQSAFYTCPLKLLEAMAAGAAIVTSDLPSIREIVSSEEAILVRPGDPYDLARGIRELLEDHDLQKKIARRAWIRAHEYTWEMRAYRIRALAEEVLRHGTR